MCEWRYACIAWVCVCAFACVGVRHQCECFTGYVDHVREAQGAQAKKTPAEEANYRQQQQQIIIIITRGKIVVPVSVKVFSVSVLTGVLFVVEQLMQVVVLPLTLAQQQQQQQMIVFLVYV